MTKNILLATAAFAAIGFAGAAQAQDLTWGTASVTYPTYLDDALVPGGPTDSYLLAQEVNPAAFTSATAGVALTHTLSAGSTLPSGNVVLTVTISNASFGAGSTLSANRVTGNGSGFTVAPTTFAAGNPGGIPASGVQTRSYIISTTANDVSEINLDLPVVPAINGSPVVVTSTIRTENGNVIDSAVSLTVINYANAFQFEADATLNGATGAINKSIARLNPAENVGGNTDDPYVEFVLDAGPGAVIGTHDGATEDAANAQIGTVTMTHNANTHYDLEANLTDPSHVSRLRLTINGDMNAYNFDGDGDADDLGYVTVGTVNPGNENYAVTSNTALFDTDTTVAGGQAATFLATDTNDIFAADLPVRLQADGDEINRSDYDVVANYNFDQSIQNGTGVPYYIVTEAGFGALEPITRQGTTVIVPWTVSRTLNGNQDAIRIGNLRNVPTGPVLVRVLNTGRNGAGDSLAGAGYVPAGAVQVASSIPANEELQLNSAQLGAFLGDYGRGDIEVTIEALQGEVTVRRFRRDAANVWTEVASGTVAADQNYDEQP